MIVTMKLLADSNCSVGGGYSVYMLMSENTSLKNV